MLIEYLKYAGILAGLILIQKTLIWLVAVTSYEITPDIVLIGVVYVSLRKGKIAGSVGGFFTGLILDFLSFSFLGLMALSKTVAGFIAGFMQNELKLERYLSSYIFVLIVLLCSLINNLLYFMIYYQGTMLAPLDILLRYVVPSSVYTAFVSIIAVIINRKKLFTR